MPLRNLSSIQNIDLLFLKRKKYNILVKDEEEMEKVLEEIKKNQIEELNIKASKNEFEKNVIYLKDPESQKNEI